MRKERKVKIQKQDKHTMLIIGITLGVFLVAILYLNARSAFKKIETRNCFKAMALMQEGMLQMKKEHRFDVPADISFKDLSLLMAYYFHFGAVVLDDTTSGALKLKPKEQTANLPLVERKSRYILDTPKCPSKGTYSLIPSKTHPGLFEISCSVHGTVYLPDKQGKYAFDGDIDALNPRKSDLGREAEIYFAPEETHRDSITVIPFAQPTPAPAASPKEPTAKKNVQ